MGTGRLEAFSDGVLAIIITIMVLELKIPHGSSYVVLKPLLSVLLSYILSFIYIGIYWINHHHLMQVSEYVSAGVLWANLHLLFWLSLIPFVTGWVGENNFAQVPIALYGFVLLMSSLAYWILQLAILSKHKQNSMVATALTNNTKGLISVLLYAVSIPSAFIAKWLSELLFILVALIWLIPDRRIEEIIEEAIEEEIIEE
jgi:uncharacterized membrane protein